MFVKMYTMGMGRLCGVGKVPTDPEFLMFSEIEIFILKQYMYVLSISISWNAFDLILSDPI